MIEITKRKYWLLCKFPDCDMYLKFLTIDGKSNYRMFKDVEEWNELRNTNKDLIQLFESTEYNDSAWYHSDEKYSDAIDKFWCIPIRDLHHDSGKFCFQKHT